MAYTLPQALVFQELQLVPQPDTARLSPHISGGHAQLIRYGEADEKDDGFLGYYDPALDECFGWPQRPAGGSPDPAYTQVAIDQALLRYFQDFIGADSAINTVAGRTNQVRSDTLSFKANGDAWPRSDEFEDRDVQVGDIAKVRAVVGSDVFTLWTYVSGFVAEIIDPVVAAATADEDNAEDQANPAPAFEYVGSDELRNCVDITSADDSAYDGLADGDINETYTITVLEGSAGGNAATARLRVTSASGNDDVDEVVPAAFGSPTSIGSRGLTVTWDDENTPECSLSAQNNSLSDIDFIPGQSWQVTCGQAFTAPEATSGGTYEGAEDMVYIVEVTLGGLYADSPRITVTSDKGLDASGPTVVPAAATAVAIGTQGTTISFDGTGLRRGDRYFVVVTAESSGAVQTLVLGHNLAPEVQDNGETEVDLSLFIKRDLVVPAHREDVPGIYNWTQSDTELCLVAGLTVVIPEWTVDDVPSPLPVISESTQRYGRVYVTARYWLAGLCTEVGNIHDVALLDDAISGPLHPDNPLKWGVFKALSNSNGAPVGYTSVCDPADPDSWLPVLELLDGRDDFRVYGLVPLTRNRTVLDAFQAHVNTQSSPEVGRWKVLWVNLPGEEEKTVLDADSSSDGEVVLGTLQDDPDTSGAQYTLLQVPAGNSRFVENGVRPGDVLRYLYTTDGFGGTVYDEFVVDEVLNENTLRLVSPGHTAAVNVPQKLEVHRNLTPTEMAEEIAQHGYGDRRVRAVWPDRVGSGGLEYEGYHLCAALAGLVAGVVPQQGLTNLEVNGFDDLSRTVDLFNRAQLNIMAEAGVWIVTQDRRTGKVFTRHAVTTGEGDDLNQREEMITRNLDDISYFFLDLYAPYIGIANVTDSLFAVLRAETSAGIQTLRSRNFVQRLGAQLIEGEIAELRPHLTLKDRILVRLNLDLPEPANNVECHLVV